jgi:hypothetical protein
VDDQRDAGDRVTERLPLPQGAGGVPAGERIAAELESLRTVAVALRTALAGGRTAPDSPHDLAALARRAGETVEVERRQIDALIALGILGRMISAGTSSLVWIPDALAAARSGERTPGTGPIAQIDQLEAIAATLEQALAGGRSVGDAPASVTEASRRVAPGAPAAAARQIDALVELGILGRVVSAGETRLVWMLDGWARGPAGAAPAADADANEEFRLDLAIDVERERLLLYRIALVFEIIAAIAIVRQLILGLA